MKPPKIKAKKIKSPDALMEKCEENEEFDYVTPLSRLKNVQGEGRK